MTTCWVWHESTSRKLASESWQVVQVHNLITLVHREGTRALGGLGFRRDIAKTLLLRVMGKLSFATLKDSTGQCQIWVQMASVGEEFYKQVWKNGRCTFEEKQDVRRLKGHND